MKNVKHVLAIMLVAAMVVSLLAGCGSNQPATPPETTKSATEMAAQSTGAPTSPTPEGKLADTIDVVIDNNPITNLDPAVPASQSPGTYWALIMTHDTLVTSAGNGNYDPNIATEWSTEDSKTYNFKLRDDIVFDNGEKLTADDVVFSCERALDAPGSPAAGQWASVETIKALGDYEVEMVLKKVNVNFLFNMSNTMTSILNRKAVEADIERGPWVGTGSFKVDDFLSGETM